MKFVVKHSGYSVDKLMDTIVPKYIIYVMENETNLECYLVDGDKAKRDMIQLLKGKYGNLPVIEVSFIEFTNKKIKNQPTYGISE